MKADSNDETPLCKVCGAAAAPFGSLDFNRSCEVGHGVVLPPAGVDVPYWRCTVCGLIFTTAFDGWDHAEFETRIYNSDYPTIDPDVTEKRPLANSRFLSSFFSRYAKALKLLDYGGGNGRLAADLRRRGFSAETYDPFTSAFAERPRRRFNIVSCFETLEHMPHPKAGAADIDSMLHPGGLLVFSTLIQPPDIAEIGLRWWYAGPRNGHVTLHTQASLAALWAPFGLSVVSLNTNIHAAYRQPPAFARELLARAQADASAKALTSRAVQT